MIVQVPRPQRRAPRDRAWGRIARREVARRLLRRARGGLGGSIRRINSRLSGNALDGSIGFPANGLAGLGMLARLFSYDGARPSSPSRVSLARASMPCAGLPRLRGHRYRAMHPPAPSSSCSLSRACERSSLPLSPPILRPLFSPWKAPASQHRFVQLLYPLWRHRFSRTDGARYRMLPARWLRDLRPCARHGRGRAHRR